MADSAGNHYAFSVVLWDVVVEFIRLSLYIVYLILGNYYWAFIKDPGVIDCGFSFFLFFTHFILSMICFEIEFRLLKPRR